MDTQYVSNAFVKFIVIYGVLYIILDSYMPQDHVLFDWTHLLVLAPYPLFSILYTVQWHCWNEVIAAFSKSVVSLS